MISIAHSPSQSKSTHLQINVFSIVFICLTFPPSKSNFKLILEREENILYVFFWQQNIAAVYNLWYNCRVSSVAVWVLPEKF